MNDGDLDLSEIETETDNRADTHQDNPTIFQTYRDAQTAIGEFHETHSREEYRLSIVADQGSELCRVAAAWKEGRRNWLALGGQIVAGDA